MKINLIQIVSDTYLTPLAVVHLRSGGRAPDAFGAY